MPTTLTNGIQLPDKGSVDWYNSMQSNYNLIDTHLGNTDTHVTAEDKANWNSKQGSLSQAQLDAIAQVSTNTNDIATLQSGKANASHTHSSSDITDIGDYATKQYVDSSISGLVDNAPAALDTLKELSTALNDDANFASTVATALSAKANSADLATVATSGSYTDLTDKPTIPTNTSDLTNDSGFVVSSNLATIATSGDYDDLSNKPSIPTNTSDLNNDSGFVTLNDFDIPAKTSDLTNDSGFITSSDVPTSTSDLINDSNFVDTSNSAVSSGITSAKVTSYDSHIADTDIHVTTADKTKWNNNVTQSYVFRYSGTAVVPNSTIAYSTIDNTDNIKSGDKILDVDGKLFEITAVDTTNQTVTVSSALIDLALDANVVHTSGDETVGGKKELSEITTFAGSSLGNEGSNNARTCMYSYCNRDTKDYSGIYQRRVRQNREQGQMSGNDISQYAFDILENKVRTNNILYFVGRDFTNDIPKTMYIASQCNTRKLGSSLYPWSDTITNQINGINPGALSFPDLNNGIDISGYLTNLNGSNTYTPVVNGWLSLGCANPSAQNAMYAYDEVDGWGISARSISHSSYSNFMVMSLPVFANKTINIELRSVTNVVWAKFFPCQGNV